MENDSRVEGKALVCRRWESAGGDKLLNHHDLRCDRPRNNHVRYHSSAPVLTGARLDTAGRAARGCPRSSRQVRQAVADALRVGRQPAHLPAHGVSSATTCRQSRPPNATQHPDGRAVHVQLPIAPGRQRRERASGRAFEGEVRRDRAPARPAVPSRRSRMMPVMIRGSPRMKSPRRPAGVPVMRASHGCSASGLVDASHRPSSSKIPASPTVRTS